MVTAPHPASPSARATIVLGVIGGSGLYQMAALADGHEVEVTTPFGAASGPFVVASLPRPHAPAVKLVFVARHGRGHTLLPSEINSLANIHGMKQLGVTHLVGVSAVGSLREEIAPGQLVVPDQLIDRTRGRRASFFGDGVVAHVQFGEPTTVALRHAVAAAARTSGATVREGGTLVVMEGPAFSTKAESHLYRSWGADLIGMTALPEAKLAREAEMAYACLALATDYDCWHEAEAEVSVDAVMAIMAANVAHAQATLVELATRLPERCADMPYPEACRFALMTNPEQIDDRARVRLDLIIGHYLQT